LGYTLGNPSAQIITVSHQHPGHNYVQGVTGEPKVLTGPGEYEIAGVLVIGIATFHDEDNGKQRGKNTAFLMQMDGLQVCHLGDLGHVLTTEQAEELENVDVLLLPVGGVSTINAVTAAKVVRQLEPRIVIPMHYKSPFFVGELDPVDKFLKEIGVREAAFQPKLNVTRNNLPLTTQVMLLNC
jgi:L-ascorbate metabolism protein UlaG (beta-lactamase superfamily)